MSRELNAALRTAEEVERLIGSDETFAGLKVVLDKDHAQVWVTGRVPKGQDPQVLRNKLQAKKLESVVNWELEYCGEGKE